MSNGAILSILIDEVELNPTQITGERIVKIFQINEETKRNLINNEGFIYNYLSNIFLDYEIEFLYDIIMNFMPKEFKIYKK